MNFLTSGWVYTSTENEWLWCGKFLLLPCLIWAELDGMKEPLKSDFLLRGGKMCHSFFGSSISIFPRPGKKWLLPLNILSPIAIVNCYSFCWKILLFIIFSHFLSRKRSVSNVFCGLSTFFISSIINVILVCSCCSHISRFSSDHPFSLQWLLFISQSSQLLWNVKPYASLYSLAPKKPAQPDNLAWKFPSQSK